MRDKKRKIEKKAVQPKPLDPRIAFFYSLFGGPLGQVYCGRFRRGIVLWLTILFIQLAILSCAATLPIGRVGFVLILLLAILVVPVLWVDASILAKRCRTNPKSRYQRWWFY